MQRKKTQKTQKMYFDSKAFSDGEGKLTQAESFIKQFEQTKDQKNIIKAVENYQEAEVFFLEASKKFETAPLIKAYSKFYDSSLKSYISVQKFKAQLNLVPCPLSLQMIDETAQALQAQLLTNKKEYQKLLIAIRRSHRESLNGSKEVSELLSIVLPTTHNRDYILAQYHNSLSQEKEVEKLSERQISDILNSLNILPILEKLLEDHNNDIIAMERLLNSQDILLKRKEYYEQNLNKTPEEVTAYLDILDKIADEFSCMADESKDKERISHLKNAIESTTKLLHRTQEYKREIRLEIHLSQLRLLCDLWLEPLAKEEKKNLQQETLDYCKQYKLEELAKKLKTSNEPNPLADELEASLQFVTKNMKAGEESKKILPVKSKPEALKKQKEPTGKNKIEEKKLDPKVPSRSEIKPTITHNVEKQNVTKKLETGKKQLNKKTLKRLKPYQEEKVGDHVLKKGKISNSSDSKVGEVKEVQEVKNVRSSTESYLLEILGGQEVRRPSSVRIEKKKQDAELKLQEMDPFGMPLTPFFKPKESAENPNNVLIKKLNPSNILIKKLNDILKNIRREDQIAFISYMHLYLGEALFENEKEIFGPYCKITEQDSLKIPKQIFEMVNDLINGGLLTAKEDDRLYKAQIPFDIKTTLFSAKDRVLERARKIHTPLQKLARSGLKLPTCGDIITNGFALVIDPMLDLVYRATEEAFILPLPLSFERMITEKILSSLMKQIQKLTDKGIIHFNSASHPHPVSGEVATPLNKMNR